MEFRRDFTFAFLLLFLWNRRNVCATKLGNCPKYAEDVDFHHPLANHVDPNPTGVWVSSQCEIVPKSNFIMRRLDILNSRWTGRIYHYEDSWCTKPTFYVKIRGTYSILPTTATPNSKASYGANFPIGNVYMTSDKVDVLEDAIDFILQKCPGALDIMSMTKDGKINLDAYRNKDIQLDVEGLQKSKHCRYYFAVHPISYGKVRMTGESDGKTPTPPTSGKHPREFDKLYFAAIPPFHTSRDTKGPSVKFQYGLSRLDRPDCPVCKGIHDQEDPSAYPVLKAPRRSKNFGGSWVTKTCVASDDTTFQTDFYTFTYQHRSGGSFEFHENIFADADCRVKTMNHKSGGTFTIAGQAPGLKGVYKVGLKVTSLSMTIFSTTILSMVKNDNCGDSKKWRIGLEQNLTEHNGCSILGFVIPASFDLLIRVSKTKTSQHFYISEPINPNEKGVYFSPPFVACDSVTENFKARLTTTGPPVVTRRLLPVVTNFKFDTGDTLGGRGSGAVGGCRVTFFGLMVCTLLSIVFCF